MRAKEDRAGYAKRAANLSVNAELLDEARALEAVTGTYLKQLFQLGYSLVRRLRREAAPFSSDDHATGSVLAGLSEDFPRFYRGLDASGIDGYREFADLEDVRAVEKFLALLAG